MFSSLSQRSRTWLMLAGCAAISFFSVKILILDSDRRITETQTEKARMSGEIAAQHEEINKITALLERIRYDAQQKRSGALASGMQQAESIKLLMPDSGLSKGGLRTISVDGGDAGDYSFSMSIAASFPEACEYMRWLERERPAVVIDEVTLSPWVKDTTQVHLELNGSIGK